MLARLGGVALVVGGLVALGMLGWHWYANVVCTQIEVQGVEHASADTLRSLARVDTGTTMMEIDPTLVADRVTRHPWVKDARVRRSPDGTLRIRVTERTPAALVVDNKGRPAYYLDAEGYMMSLPAEVSYDVPLVWGVRTPFNPVQPLAHPPLQQALNALAATDTYGLVSEVDVRPDSSIHLYTLPMPDRRAVRVQLGHHPYDDKLKRLHTFWEQVISRPSPPPVGFIDLRFDGQVITRPQTYDG